MNGGIARRDRTVIWRGVLAAEVGDDTAGLADDEQPCGDVPGREVELPERLEAAACYIAEVERRGAGAAQSRGALHDARHDGQVRADSLAILERKAGADQRAR